MSGSTPGWHDPVALAHSARSPFWVKGIVLTWAPLHGKYPSSAATRFRSQSGTLHLAQLLQDRITLQHRRGETVWLKDSPPATDLMNILLCIQPHRVSSSSPT